MKAAIYPGHGGQIVIEDIPDPTPGANDVIIKVDRCGICGTDLSMTRGGNWDFGENTQFGHEFAGEVIEIGRNVDRLKKGDRIAVLPSVGCGICAGCGFENNVLCHDMPDTAATGFAEFARVPVSVATLLPSVLSFADGALIEPLAVSLYGIKFAQIKQGDRVLVLGGGTVALYAIYWARRLGAGKIVALSRSVRRQGLCLDMGADAFVPFGADEVERAMDELGGAPDVVLECVGASGMLPKAVHHAAQFGKIVSLGFGTSPDPLVPGEASYKCVSIQFAVGYSMREFLYIADEMNKGHVDPKAIITNEIALPNLPEMMTYLRGDNEETKVHVKM